MKFAIFTIVEHSKLDDLNYGYAPYIREMDIWSKYVDEVIVLAPKSSSNKVSAIELPYSHSNVRVVTVPNFNITTFFHALKAVIVIPVALFRIAKVMHSATHLHIRCPGNISLLACIVQICFPSKIKTTKYAGNWDPKSKQPRSYRLQKWILSNTFLTKNMQVLVYGEWENQTKNIKPFISATYYENEKIDFKPRHYNEELQFVFAASLVVGKRPLLTIKIIEALNKKGIKAKLHMYGNGPLMSSLKAYVKDNNLEDYIILYGNQNKDVIKSRLKGAHFNILPSKSEGWPKAVAEGMFFGCIPISTPISCLNWMLNNGKRGIIITPVLEDAVNTIINHLNNENLNKMAELALNWSQHYTLDKLELEIKKTLEP